MSQSSLCYKCHQPSETLKRCSGCEKVWYCSTECHSAHWVEHIFDCVPRRPITTADHLALAVHTNILPLHKQTSSEYGFDSAWTASNRMFLLKIYTGLIKELGVSPKTIRKWRAAGILLNEIKREFPILLIQRHGQPYLACFSWLLENEWVLNGQSPEHSLSLRIKDGLKAFERAWHLLGGPRDVDLEEANMIVLQWPPDKRECFEFYRGAVINWYPLRSVPRWLWFGFCACAGEKDEYDLNNRLGLCGK
ncbi:hypothetical protein EWM64_g9900 [Hericium alpestre]|uniref:MYND-type domain-containing protein n=1 Tax=Hericium alpestre TaxID=135208 RepID=A0A4Y9ZJS7_9AGAM|nr:hypothetical protein EWM64_g9900 [Hericium alpestre]